MITTLENKEIISDPRIILDPYHLEVTMNFTEARPGANHVSDVLRHDRNMAEAQGRSRSHTLMAGPGSRSVVGLGEAEVVRDRAGELAGNASFARGIVDWFFEQAALYSLRIERCQQTERAIRDRIVARAKVTWDEDQRLEATLLAGKLARNPEQVSAQLRETFHGVEWLMTRWAMLAHSADVHTTWTPEQTVLAYNLLGASPEFREGHPPGTFVDFDGRLINPLSSAAAVARREIAELKPRLEKLRGLDQAARQRAEADLSDDTHPDLKKHRRYEASLHNRLRWALKQAEVFSTEDETNTSGGSEPDSEPEASTRPSRESEPVPARSTLRVEKKLEKAEARREARLRKLDRRRS